MVRWPVTRLREVAADVFVGLSLHHARQGMDVVPIVSVGDLHEGSVPPTDALPVRELDAQSIDERYRLREGDLLITARGSQLKVAWTQEFSAGAVASSTLLVIRPGARLSAPLLYAVLSSDEGRSRLSARAKRSTSTLALTVRDAGEVQIPVPPREVQEIIGKLVEVGEEQFRISMKLATAQRLLAQSAAARVLWDAGGNQA